MIHPNSSVEVSYLTVGLMEDIWHKKHFLNPQAYFVFRLDAACFEANDYTNIFVHFLIDNDNWYCKISDREYGVTIEDLKVQLPDEDIRGLKQVKSWRHYAFSDLVGPMIKKELDAAIKAAEFGNIDQYTIWDTFPARNIEE